MTIVIGLLVVAAVGAALFVVHILVALGGVNEEFEPRA